MADSAPAQLIEVPPALRLIAAACRWPGDAVRNAAVREAAEGFRDWPELMRLVDRHRVPGLVQKAFAAAGVTVPEPARAELARAAGAVALKSMACAAETVQLQQLLDDAGIAVTFFKGVTLGARAYGSIALKHGKDVDCLISARDVRRCVALLEDHGYRLVVPRRRLSSRQWRILLRVDKEVVLLSKTGIQVEVHWGLTGISGMLPPTPLIAAVSRGDMLAGRAIAGFAPDDLFAYLCAHGAESGWSRIKWLADLNALIAPASPAELEQLFRHAEVRRAGPAAALALALCADWFGRALPPPARAAMRGKWALRAMHAIALANLRADDSALPWYRDTPMKLLLAVTHGGLPGQLVRSMIAVDDAMRFQLPRPLYFLYPLLRVPSALWRKMHARRVAEGHAAGYT